MVGSALAILDWVAGHCGYRDIGRLAVFLAGPDCFMTGQTFYIDGGRLMP